MDSSEALLSGLDEQQRAAAMAIDGPVRIIACAGAGKTRTITRRIAYACSCGQWDVSRVLAVTFSVKAAAQMRARLQQLGIERGARVATFHSAALSQLRFVWDDVCASPFPEILDNPRQVVTQAALRLSELSGVSPSQVRDIHAEIDWAKVSLIAPEDYVRVCSATHRIPPAGLSAERFVDVYDAYEREKAARNGIDFNDILLLLGHVLQNFEEPAQSIRRSIGWLTVDEYQDVSPLQHYLLRAWMGTNRNLCVVGDPAQTIYSFAGATSYYLLNFNHEFAPICSDVSLCTDYRSTERIVGLANRVLSRSEHRKDYLKLVSAQRGGQHVMKRVYETDQAEALGIAEDIMQTVTQRGILPSDCAILTRTNAQQQVICWALSAVGLKYRIRRDNSMQETMLETKQIINHGSLSGTLQEDHDRFSSVRDLLRDMPSNAENIDLKKQMPITVCTIHAAKGLEFKHVYVAGCAEGLMPYGKSIDDLTLEEERRLMYVAVTRAEQTLHLSYAVRALVDSGRARVPSRFLA